MPPGDPAEQWIALLPVKPSQFAKSRLVGLAGTELAVPTRAELATAMALDTIDAVMACPAIGRTVVVGADAQTQAGFAPEIETWDGEPGAGLNAALRYAAARLSAERPAAKLVIISADLPALRPHELATVLRAAETHPRSFLADSQGIGTTLYATLQASGADPRFGGRSRAAHRAAGCVELDLADVTSVRRDVDTEVDLWDALRLGAGRRTESLARRLSASAVPPGDTRGPAARAAGDG